MWPLPKVIMRLGSEAFSLPQELLFDTSAPGGRLKDAFWNNTTTGYYRVQKQPQLRSQTLSTSDITINA